MRNDAIPIKFQLVVLPFVDFAPLKLNSRDQMKLILTALVLTLCCSSVSIAQVAVPGGAKEARKYAKSFRGQDLSQRKFLMENLDNCDFEDANLSSAEFTGSSLKNCNFRGATLTGAIFNNADLTGSDFRESEFKNVRVSYAILNEVNFEGLDLSTIQLNERKLRGANLRNVKGVWLIYKADFYEADLRGANFTDAIEDQPAAFRKAKYDQFTRWHKNFDPKSRGLVFEELKPESDQPGGNMEEEFTRLDANQDGVLSGNEATSYLAKDANGDREITQQEFGIAKR